MVYGFKGDFIESLKYYFKLLKYSRNNEERDTIINFIDELYKIVIRNYPNIRTEFNNRVIEFKACISEVDARYFQLNGKEQSLSRTCY